MHAHTDMDRAGSAPAARQPVGLTRAPLSLRHSLLAHCGEMPALRTRTLLAGTCGQGEERLLELNQVSVVRTAWLRVYCC